MSVFNIFTQVDKQSISQSLGLLQLLQSHPWFFDKDSKPSYWHPYSRLGESACNHAFLQVELHLEYNQSLLFGILPDKVTFNKILEDFKKIQSHWQYKFCHTTPDFPLVVPKQQKTTSKSLKASSFSFNFSKSTIF